MKISRLALGLTLSILTLTSAQAAKYSLIELPLRDFGVNSFGSAINEKGEVAASIASPFNPPIDVDIINFDDETLIQSLTDANAASVGNINDEDLLTLYNFITASTRSGSGNTITRNNFFKQSNESKNPFLQQIANVQSYVLVNNEAEAIVAFDEVSQELGGLTKSADTLVRGINGFSATVGLAEAPFKKISYRNANGDSLQYHAQDFIVRGFLDINGNTFPIIPTETIGGGISVANDINDSFEVAGFGSIEVIPSYEALLEECKNDRTRPDLPEESCIRTLRDQYLASVESNFRSSRRPIDTTYLRRAMIWEFNALGELLDTDELGTLVDPVPGDLRLFSSRAVAINNNGIAVGASDAYFQDNQNSIIEMAAIFDGDDVVGFIDDQTHFRSEALDINDNDIAVGYATKVINGTSRNKFFVHDYRGEVTTFPDDFFASSSSIARAINNNGLVVGEGEVDTNLSGSRRSEAFLYDYISDEFSNINDLLSCDSPYTIVQANDINDEGEIAATAVIYRERSSINGKLALDAQGNTIFGNVSVAVKLVPISGGSADDCSQKSLVPERKGAASGAMLLLLLLTLIRIKLK
jgi:hypothetical protein